MILSQGSANFYKWSESQYFGLCWPYGLCKPNTPRPSAGTAVRKRGWPCPAKLHLQMLTSEFHVIFYGAQNRLLLTFPQMVQNVETTLGLQAIDSEAWAKGRSWLNPSERSQERGITGPHTFLSCFLKCFIKNLMKQDVIHIS